MLALLAIALLAQSDDCARSGGRCRDARNGRPSGAHWAFFEFAPVGGAGMGSPCACASPTGVRGEALTFTRASSGTCLKGNTTTSIANGDMVTCSSDQPRVMPGGDGTGGNGLLVESARTNEVPRSQEFDNAAWTLLGSVVAAPTVTANAAVAPDGTTTADRIQVTACNGSGASAIYQTGVCTGTASRSLFLKGTSGSGFTRLTDGSGIDTQCSYNSTTWTRCLYENSAASTTYLIGNNCAGGDTMAAGDFYAWGAQCETGAYASSYIATAGATATRAVEAADFTMPASAFNSGSAAASILALGATGGVLAWGANNRMLYIGLAEARMYDSTTVLATTAGTFPNSTIARLWSSWAGSSMTITNVTDNKTATGAYDGSMQSGTTLQVAHNPTGAATLDGVIKRVCLDPNPARCR